jgi:phosphoribosylformylglycinamidine cyclo-ligase
MSESETAKDAPRGGAYRAAGVDIDKKYDAVKRAHEAIRASHGPGVLGDVGAFGGLFDLAAAGAAGELLVASTDGVGTKVLVAKAAGRLPGVGADLVNHCVDDILVQGARPLFFLDYIAVDTMEPESIGGLIRGLADACRANGCALLGGETAEMPGVYRPGEVDVAGTIIGSVPRERLLDGSRIRVGDTLIGLPSSGLHTNGYSLARRILFGADADPDSVRRALDERPDALGGASIADALLAPHRSYLAPLMPLLRDEAQPVRALAHITGGGLQDNVPRVLPSGCGVVVRRGSMPRPPIFDLLVERGSVDPTEAYRVFNMGFGMVVFVAKADAEGVLAGLRRAGEDAHVIGEVVADERRSVALVD